MAPSVSVAEYYANKSIFITGATGFMGKVLVEKLLRSCPNVAKIYILMRSKRGRSCKERLDEFLNCKIFECLKKEKAEIFGKLQMVPGDILLKDLGLSLQDREELQRECQIIFHCAACVRFDMPLRDAVNLNTVATKMVLELAEGMKKLEVFLHTSTAYNRCELPLLEEKVYPSNHKPQQIIDCMEWMDDELVSHMELKLIHPQPNTYSFTKALTEDLVSQYEGKFPIVVARPSIVIASFKEPMPGWIDNINGPTGLIIGSGKGVIRSMLCNEKALADVIPVDMAVNACILLAYLTGYEKPREIQIYNVSQSGQNPITWGEALEMGRHHVQEFPFTNCLWYPDGSPKTSWLSHELSVIFFHLLPAYFIDLFLFLLGKKTFMVKVQKRIRYGLAVLQYYTMRDWHFKNEKYLGIRKKISTEDDKVFYTDINMINWSDYIRLYIKGIKEFYLKEDPSTLPQARKLHIQLYYLDRATKTFFVLACLYVAYNYLSYLLVK